MVPRECKAEGSITGSITGSTNREGKERNTAITKVDV